MRVLTFLTQLEACGGVETSVFQVTRELAARGHQIDMACVDGGDLSDEFVSFCEAILPGPQVRYSGSISDARRLLPRIYEGARRRPDLVYTHNMSELGWGVGIHLVTRAPIVGHIHEFAPFRKTSISVLGGRVSRFVVASDYMLRVWSAQGLPAERVDVVPYGFAFADYPPGSDEARLRSREMLGVPPGAYVVLSMGRLVPEKGVEVLLDAWRQLGYPADEARLLVVGTPQDPADEDEYVRGLRDRAPGGCDWLPMRRDVISLLHAADVLVLPSMWEEPFGRVIVEAMSTGRPAVASAVGGIPEILDGEFDRMLFPRGDARALADRLRELNGWRRDDPHLAERCIAHVERKYQLTDMVTKLEKIFVDATNNHGKVARDS